MINTNFTQGLPITNASGGIEGTTEIPITDTGSLFYNVGGKLIFKKFEYNTWDDIIWLMYTKLAHLVFPCAVYYDHNDSNTFFGKLAIAHAYYNATVEYGDIICTLGLHKESSYNCDKYVLAYELSNSAEHDYHIILGYILGSHIFFPFSDGIIMSYELPK